jgi:hypothetical protein
MKTVYKYAIPRTNRFELQLPQHAKILTANTQNAQEFLWALVEPYNPTETRKFLRTGTGDNLSHIKNLKYITTWFEDSNTLVWHLFEVEDLKPQRTMIGVLLNEHS